MPTLQNQLSGLRIVQLETSVLFLLEFESGAQIAYDCLPEKFTMDLGLKSKDVEKLLKKIKKMRSNKGWQIILWMALGMLFGTSFATFYRLLMELLISYRT